MPTAVRLALTDGQEAPRVENAVALADALDIAAAAKDRHLIDMGRLENLALRARISAAIVGDVHSCHLIALEAASRAITTTEDHLVFRYAVFERVASHLANRGLSDVEPISAQRLAQLRSEAAEDVLNVAEVVNLFQPMLGHGAVQDDTGFVPDWFTHDDNEPWKLPLHREPGLVVVNDVQHLPGSAKAGDKPGSATSLRAEWTPLAGVRLPCRPVPDLASTRQHLLDRSPHATSVVDQALSHLVGLPYAKLPPLLFLGSPGCGKTHLALEIASALTLPATVYSCAGVADSAFIGTSRQWSTGRASVPLQAIKREMLATVCMVLDEIDKGASSRHNGSISDSLLPMLDHADRYHDPYLECTTDLSAVTYIATANSLDGIPAALLDRFRIIRMPEPRRQDLPALARGVVLDLRRARGMDETWLPELDPDELALVAKHWPGGSVRRLRRIVETVIAGREVLAPRH